MSTDLKTTPLNSMHRELGANMADFGGFDMPLWYKTGIKAEHISVLTSAGIFDTSHMACIHVEGKDSYKLLNYCFTRDISTLVPGRCVYGAFLSEEGHCIDDAIVYKFSDMLFMICVNAGMGGQIANHLKNNAGSYEVIIEDLSEKSAKIDIQGINSARILKKLIQKPEFVFNAMPYFSFKGAIRDGLASEVPEVRLSDGTPILLSRSGYTGEFGFEIFIDPNAIVRLWHDILKAGKEYDVIPCGLGARDSLRAGACLPLSHQDIGHWLFVNHPWDFTLPYNDNKSSFTKNFIGAEALLSNTGNNFTCAFVGDSLRKVVPGENTKALDSSGNFIGTVLTCVTDMGITLHEGKIVSINNPKLASNIKIKGLSCGFVMLNQKLDLGTEITLKDESRSIKVKIVNDIRPNRTARMKLERFLK